MESRIIFIMAAVALVVVASGCLNSGPPAGGSGDNQTAACPQNETVMQGDHVKVQYTTRYTTGTVFDEGTIEFVSAAGQVLYGFDEAVLGMCVGQGI